MFEIPLKETEFAPLLNRKSVIADVTRAFPEQIQLLRELTNYGTNLIPRAFGSSNKDLRDVVLVGILLRQVVAMLDAIEVLSASGAVYAAGLQARALFEASIYIEWIMKADAENKAFHYYVHNLRRLRRWALRLQSGSREAKALPPAVADLNTFRDPEAVQQAQKTADDIDVILSQPRFAQINAAFDKCARDPAKGDRSWYYPFGKRTIGALITDLGRAEEYTVFYATWSEVTHGSNYGQHVQFGTGKVTFEAIRHLTGFETLFRFSIANAIRSYRAILAEYRPGELGLFSRKYIENWRSAFMQVPKIKYEVKTTGPASSG
jgi:hypothetical protein